MVLVRMAISQLSPGKKIELTHFLIGKATGNSNFPSPTPTMATMATTANAAEAALVLATKGGRDDKANLKLKIAALDLCLHQFATYVENVANANPATAETVVISAGLEVKSKVRHTVVAFDAFLTGNPGEVQVVHPGILRGVIEFQICTDITNGANWATFEISTRARVIKSGLTPNTRYYFRARTIGKNGPSAWSEVISVFVME